VVCFDMEAEGLRAAVTELAAVAASPVAVVASVGDTSCWEDVEAPSLLLSVHSAASTSLWRAPAS
jgi:hypothetical protein